METWESEPAAGASAQDPGQPADVSGSGPESLRCGEKSEPFDIPVANHSAVATSHDDASFALAAQELYDEVGLGRPSCDGSNCGFGQNCPSKGGSQTTSGGVKASWRGPTSLYVDLDIEPGTQGIRTCANCS